LMLNLRRSVVQFYSAPLVHFLSALDTQPPNRIGMPLREVYAKGKEEASRLRQGW